MWEEGEDKRKEREKKGKEGGHKGRMELEGGTEK